MVESCVIIVPIKRHVKVRTRKMEIKTLEQYVVKLLDEKDNELEDQAIKLVDLSAKNKYLEKQLDEIKSMMFAEASIHYTDDDRAWFSFSIFPSSDYYGIMEKLFRDIIENDKQDE